ncbi:MAG: hypothetical protein IJY50_05270 [Clostridia bacterium]|nr:hypothetical protein [Clostridia bacterium]
MTKAKKKILKISISISCVALALFSVFWFFPHCRHWTFRKTPVETDAFLPKPDSVLYISSSGKTRLLTDSEIERVYSAFQAATESIKSFKIVQYKSDGSVKVNAAKKIRTAEMPRLEFRYEQRYRYVGENPAQMGNGYTEPIEFDAMMLLVGEGQMTAIPYKGWYYSNASNEHAMIDFYANYYEFKEVVTTLE